MIKIDLLYKPAAKEIRDMFVLTVEYMHGDADGDTTVEHDYGNDEIENLKQDVLGLITMIKSGAEFYDAESTIAPIFEAQGLSPEDAFEAAETWADRFYEGDITSEGSPAAISGFTLAYFDGAGEKYDMEIQFNGKTVK